KTPFVQVWGPPVTRLRVAEYALRVKRIGAHRDYLALTSLARKDHGVAINRSVLWAGLVRVVNADIARSAVRHKAGPSFRVLGTRFRSFLCQGIPHFRFRSLWAAHARNRALANAVCAMRGHDATTRFVGFGPQVRVAVQSRPHHSVAGT